MLVRQPHHITKEVAIMDDKNALPHTSWRCKYHIVLIVCFIVSMAAPLVIYANRHRWLSNGKATGDEK